nr:PilZ domain-containing protein [uncultured Sphingomonas sp.]
MDESNAPKSRQNRRANVLMTATLELSGAALPVKLRNLSVDGALVEGDKLPVDGASIMFRRGDIAVPGKIAWSKGRKAGVSFVRQIGEEQVLRNIALPRQRPAQSFRRPSLKEEPSQSEREYAARWLRTPRHDD